MSADNVTLIRPGGNAHEPEATEPDWFATLPGFPLLYVMHLRTCEGKSRFGQTVVIEYRGTAEDLLASRAATADMLTINARTGKRHKRIDADGDRFGLTRIWRSTRDDTGEACPPYRYFYLQRSKPLALIDRLPGGREAIAARERRDAWWKSQRDEQDTERARSQSLRLVIDNTRVQS